MNNRKTHTACTISYEVIPGLEIMNCYFHKSQPFFNIYNSAHHNFVSSWNYIKLLTDLESANIVDNEIYFKF